MLNLIHYSDPMLFEKQETFDFSNLPVDPYKLQYDLILAMISKNLVWINANMVGLPYNVFVMATQPNLVMFNPKIVWESEKQVIMEEVCPNIPGLDVVVRRPEEVRVRFQTASSGTEANLYGGVTSRVIQHNIDFLNGERFYDKASIHSRKIAAKHFKNLMKGHKNVK